MAQACLLIPNQTKCHGLENAPLYYKEIVIRRYSALAKNYVTFINVYRAQRKPILLFVFPGTLFRFSVSTPAFVSLFQLPPRMKPNRYVAPLILLQKNGAFLLYPTLSRQVIFLFPKFSPKKLRNFLYS